MMCPCPGNREFEMLNEPENEIGQHWYVCPCCGTRKLLPELDTEPSNDTPPLDLPV